MNRYRRRAIAGLGAVALGKCLPSFAKDSQKVWRVGWLSTLKRPTPSIPLPFYDALIQGFRDAGYVEGKNLIVEARYAEGRHERFPDLAAELIRLKVDLIVTGSTPATQAAMRASSTIPIVFATINDPVGSGLAASLARPGRNATGLTIAINDVSGKQLELLKMLVPGLRRVAVLVHPDNATHSVLVKALQAAAQHYGATVQRVAARNPGEFEDRFAALAQAGVDGMVVASDGVFTFLRRQIAEQALRHRIPTVVSSRLYVEAGCLMTYGADQQDIYRRVATYADKIFKGASPATIPIEQPIKFELVINRKTAKALDLAIPQELVLRADQVIE